MFFSRLDSPIGKITLAGDGQGLRLLGFPTGKGRVEPEPHWHEDPGQFAEAADQLTEYFAGCRTEFDLPLAPRGTPFQLSVWQALGDIPFGATTSYGKLAALLGRPAAARAVGAANGANPLAIVVPCHRVIGADGSLTGFGGGLSIKQHLLTLEQRVLGNQGEQLTLAIEE